MVELLEKHDHDGVTERVSSSQEVCDKALQDASHIVVACPSFPVGRTG